MSNIELAQESPSDDFLDNVHDGFFPADLDTADTANDPSLIFRRSLGVLQRDAVPGRGDKGALSATQEVFLAKRIEKGDYEAKRRMIESNLRLVVAEAFRRASDVNGGRDMVMDMAQSGMLGLIRAVEKFDWRKGYKFSSYADSWIKLELNKGYQYSNSPVRLPLDIWKSLRKIKKAEQEFQLTERRLPTAKELVLLTNVGDEGKIQGFLDYRRYTQQDSIDEAIEHDGGSNLESKVVGKKPTALDQIMINEVEDIVAEAFEGLDEEEIEVVSTKYFRRDLGKSPGDQTVAAAIGGISRETVTKRRKTAEAKMKDSFAANGVLSVADTIY